VHEDNIVEVKVGTEVEVEVEVEVKVERRLLLYKDEKWRTKILQKWRCGN
jgi:hypothetical protein